MLNRLRAMVLTYHMVMKFPMMTNNEELRNNPRESRQSYLMTISLPNKARPETSYMDTQSFTKSLSHP